MKKKETEENEAVQTEQEQPKVYADHTPEVEGEEITLVSGAEYWDFKNNPVFIGIPTDLKNNEDGELIGVNCKSLDGKMDWLIPATHSVMNAVQSNNPRNSDQILLGAGLPMKFEFLGKVELKTGRDFNKFKISVIIPK